MSDVGCRILTSRMSHFYKSDVGFLQVGCRILTSRMSDFYKSDVECRIFKVGCRMAPISFRTFALTWCANIFVGCSVTPTFFSAGHFLF